MIAVRPVEAGQKYSAVVFYSVLKDSSGRDSRDLFKENRHGALQAFLPDRRRGRRFQCYLVLYDPLRTRCATSPGYRFDSVCEGTDRACATDGSYYIAF